MCFPTFKVRKTYKLGPEQPLLQTSGRDRQWDPINTVSEERGACEQRPGRVLEFMGKGWFRHSLWLQLEAPPDLTSQAIMVHDVDCSLRWAIDQTFQQKSTVQNLFTTAKLWKNSDRKQFSTCFSSECLYEKLIPYFVSWSHLWVRPLEAVVNCGEM